MEVVGVIGAALHVSYQLGQYIVAVKSAPERMETLRSRVQTLANVLSRIKHASTAKPDTLRLEIPELALRNCAATLDGIATRLKPARNGKRMQHALQRLQWPLKSDEVNKEIAQIDGYLVSFSAVINLDQRAIADLSHRMLGELLESAQLAEKDRMRTQLSKLNPLMEAKLGSRDTHGPRGRHSECLANTRQYLLRRIAEWSENGTHPIFWLRGLAGTGKSAIALSTAEMLRINHIVAGFFFMRGGGQSSQAARLIPTIVYQLALGCPKLLLLVSAALEKDPDLAWAPVNEQVEKLLLDPLEQRHQQYIDNSPLLVVVDALDECGDLEEIQSILHCLGRNNRIKECGLTIFLTSRPDTEIAYGFRHLSITMHYDLDLHFERRDQVDQDIATYLAHTFDRIATKRDLDEDWPEDAAIEELVKMSAGLFIFAATACRYVDGLAKSKKSMAVRRLEHILKPVRGNDKSTAPLDSMYKTVLNGLFADEDMAEEEELEEMIHHYRLVVGTIAIVRDTLSVSALSTLLAYELNGSTTIVGEIIESLQAVLYESNDNLRKIQIVHESFRDFLLDRERCTDHRLQFDIKQRAARLAEDCLELMANRLRENICALESPGICNVEIPKDKVTDALPEAVQHACLYWAEYYASAGCPSSLIARLDEFLVSHALQWLEAMSLLGSFASTITTLATLEELLSQVGPSFSLLGTHVHDLRRFTLSFQHGISQAPLQIYMCAAYFSPSTSFVRKFPNRTSKLIKAVHTEVPAAWDSRILTIEDTVGCGEVCFSPNGRIVATGGGRAVSLHDPQTGRHLKSFNMDGFHHIQDMAISYDSSMLAVAVERFVYVPQYPEACGDLSEGAALLFDIHTGDCLRRLTSKSDESNMTRRVFRVAFSADSSHLMTISEHGVLGTLDIPAQDHWAKIEEAHYLCSPELCVKDLAPITRKFASVDGRVVEIGDTRSHSIKLHLHGHQERVSCLAFSPDESVLVSSSARGEIAVWDAEAGCCRQKLQASIGDITKISVAAGGCSIALSTETYASQFWNLNVRPPRTFGNGDFNGFGRSAPATYSSGGEYLAHCTYEGCVKIFNVETGMLHATLSGFQATASSISFAADRNHLAIASLSKSLFVYDLDLPPTDLVKHDTTGLGLLRGIASEVVVSMDSNIVVTVEEGKSIRFWDADSGNCANSLSINDQMDCFVASEDACTVAWAVYRSDNLTELYTAQTDRCFQGSIHMARIEHNIRSDNMHLALSRDGSKLVACFRRFLIHSTVLYVWSTSNGELIDMLDIGDLMVVDPFFCSNDARIGLFTVDFHDIEGQIGQIEEDHVPQVWHPRSQMGVSRLTPASDCSQLGEQDRTMFAMRQNKPLSISEDEWLQRTGEKILWLPESSRPNQSRPTRQDFAAGNTVSATINALGQLTIISAPS